MATGKKVKVEGKSEALFEAQAEDILKAKNVVANKCVNTSLCVWHIQLVQSINFAHNSGNVDALNDLIAGANPAIRLALVGLFCKKYAPWLSFKGKTASIEKGVSKKTWNPTLACTEPFYTMKGAGPNNAELTPTEALKMVGSLVRKFEKSPNKAVVAMANAIKLANSQFTAAAANIN